MDVRRLPVVEEPTSGRLWQRYRETFAHLAAKAAHRQTLTREEFAEEMREPRIWKYVGFDGEEPVALGTLTRHLETMTWVSPDYFAARWPEEYAQGRVFYIGFVMLDKHNQSRGRFNELAQPMVRAIADARGVAGFDVCRYNAETQNLLIGGLRAITGPTDVPDLETIDTQTYLAISFRGADGSAPTMDGRVIDLTEAGLPNR